MSEISEAIQEKCLAFSDRIIKLNDYLLEQAASRKSEGRSQKEDTRRGRTLPSSVLPLTSRVPVHLQSVAALANQLLRSGTSIGANNAEATNAISKADLKSKVLISNVSNNSRRGATKAFTERGLYMLATVLKGERARQVTFTIIETFFKVLMNFIQVKSIIMHVISLKIDSV